ncbi:MAG TPA: hypothetical protein VIT93_03300 [Dehalococcoidia bacterium]
MPQLLFNAILRLRTRDGARQLHAVVAAVKDRPKVAGDDQVLKYGLERPFSFARRPAKPVIRYQIDEVDQVIVHRRPVSSDVQRRVGDLSHLRSPSA